MLSETVELKPEDRPFTNLPERILNGEVIMLRNCLHNAGLYKILEQASIEGIRKSMGNDIASRVQQAGFEKIHTIVSAADIPVVTDSVYEAITPKSLDFLKPFVDEVFGIKGHFFFERKPNVRFHIPHDAVAKEIKNFREFTKRHGDGKITPHKTHRDSWVDCPNNLINVWIAVGPVKTGNSLTIYSDSYRRDIKNTGPYIRNDQNPGPAQTFEMNAGDVLLFHGDHLHGSEINSTDETRHVISFRITLEKPNYVHGHYHHYAHTALANGPLNALAEVPQNLAWSYVDDRLKRVSRKLGELTGLRRNDRPASESVVEKDDETDTEETISIPLDSLEPGNIKAVTARICVAHLDSGDIVAFHRYCPHQGADLSLGSIRGHEIMCPWHNLPVDPATGSSPCQSLKKIKTYPVDIKGDRISISRHND